MSLDHDTSIMVRETVAVSVLRARLVALTFPPAPFLSPAGGEKGGGCCLPFPLAPSPLRSSLGVLVPAPVGAGFQPARWAAGREGI